MKTVFEKERESGSTVIELLVASFILLFLLGITLEIAIIAKKYWQSADSSVEVRQNASIVLEKMRREMEDSALESFTDNTGWPIRAISFLSPRDQNNKVITNPAGKVKWQKYIIYYLQTNSTVLMRREVYGNFSGGIPLTPAQLNSYCNGTGLPAGFSVKSISAELSIPNKRVIMKIEIENRNPKGQVNTFNLNSIIFTNN